jgi:hypothetical protein
MNQLQTFKQKGRLLRAHLAQVFGREVTLAQAYEALAASEGTTWNVLSARLAAAKPEKVPGRLVAPGPLLVRAILTTGDDKAAAEFDAVPWLEWAGKDRIARLLRQEKRNPVTGFSTVYGGKNDLAEGIAHYCSGREFGSFDTAVLTTVYNHVGAKDRLGHDYGDLYCYVDQADLLKWLKTQEYGDELLAAVQPGASAVAATEADVNDVDLDTPAQTSKMLEVCQAAWENAKLHWASTREGGGRCEYLIERGDVLNALSDCSVIPTEGTADEPEYASVAVRAVERSLEVLGYELHARYLAQETIWPDEPMLGMTTFGQLAVGDWFRNVHSCTLYRKESETTVRAYKEVDATPFSQTFQMEEGAMARIVKRQKPQPQ